MPAVVACPKCKKKYKLPDKMLGKGVKCTECQTQFKTPAPKATVTAAKADQRRAAAAQKAAESKARQTQDLAALGVDGVIERPVTDVFAGLGTAGMKGTPDPLANHPLEDPGFGDGAEQAIAPAVAEKPDDPLSSMFANPALAKKDKKRHSSGKGKKKGEGFGSQVWLYLSVVFIPIFAVLLVLSLTKAVDSNTISLITMIAYGVFYLAMFAVSIWGFIRIYQVTESVVLLLLSIFLFFPIFYVLYKNWSELKNYGKALIACLVILVLAVTTVFIAFGAAVNDAITG